MKLKDYIEQQHGSQTQFATTEGTTPQQVTQWLNKRFIVVNGVLYSPRRELLGCVVSKASKGVSDEYIAASAD